jgi:hypothetical protein
MRFCGSACRQAAFRAKKWASRYEGREPLRSNRNNDIASMACNGHFRHRASGICGPMQVISRELFAGLTWCPVVSGDGERAEVARLGNGEQASPEEMPVRREPRFSKLHAGDIDDRRRRTASS